MREGENGRERVLWAGGGSAGGKRGRGGARGGREREIAWWERVEIPWP